jgi:hypothetical protein
MSMNCLDTAVVIGCRRFPTGTTETVNIHYEYRAAANGELVIYKTRYTDAVGAAITLGVGEVVTPGACEIADIETAQRCYRVIVSTPYANEGDTIINDTILVVSPTTGQFDPALSYDVWSNQTQGTLIGVVQLNGTVSSGVEPARVTEIVPCEEYTETLRPRSLDATGTGIVTVPDALVRSITVTREVGGVRFSTDAGTTWTTMNVNGSRTWGSPNSDVWIDTTNMQFAGLTATSNYDLIWEI